jgi:hypothetical protein
VSAGIINPRHYADYPEDDFYDGPERVFDHYSFSRTGEYQAERLQQNPYRAQTRASYASTFRPERPFSETFSYALPTGLETDHGEEGWFRSSSPRSTAAEAVYVYSADEPMAQPGHHGAFGEQARQIGDDLFRNRPIGGIVVLAILCLLVCGSLTWLNTFGRAEADIYSFGPAVSSSTTTTNNPASNPAEAKPMANPPAAVPGANSVIGSPTITADKIAQILKQYNSPAVGASKAIYDLGVKYGIDPAYAVAFFIHESSAGTKGIAVTTKSMGNIRQTTNSGFEGYNGFRKYPTWEAGAEDWYKLIRNLYIEGWKLTTVEQIIPKYAPSEDNNNPPAYINAVNRMVENWRNGK